MVIILSSEHRVSWGTVFLTRRTGSVVNGQVSECVCDTWPQKIILVAGFPAALAVHDTRNLTSFNATA